MFDLMCDLRGRWGLRARRYERSSGGVRCRLYRSAEAGLAAACILLVGCAGARRVPNVRAVFAEPVVLTDGLFKHTASTTVQDLALDAAARAGMPRNIAYNVEYRWSDDERHLQVFFRPMVKGSEMTVAVRFDVAVELGSDEG